MTESPAAAFSPSAQKYDDLFAWSLGLAILAIFPLARFAPKGLAPLLVVFALIGAAYWLVKRPRISITPVATWAALFVALTLASALWSITPGTTIKTATSLVGTLLCAYTIFHLVMNLPDDSQMIARRIFVYGGLVALAALAIDLIPQEVAEHIYGTEIKSKASSINFWNVRKPALTIAALLIWPWLGAARNILPRSAIIGAIIAYLIIVGASDAGAARGAGILAVAAAIAVFFFQRAVLGITAVGLILAIFAAPLIPPMMTDPQTLEARYDGFSESAIHRISIWQRSAEKIKDNPVAGSGFDTVRALYGSWSARSTTFLPGTERRWTVMSEPIPLHPHNAFLQIWIELGAIGAALCAAFLCALIYVIAQKSRDDLTCAVSLGAFVSGTFIANISFGAWQAWWIAALILIGALIVLALRPTSAEPKQI